MRSPGFHMKRNQYDRQRKMEIPELNLQQIDDATTTTLQMSWKKYDERKKYSWWIERNYSWQTERNMYARGKRASFPSRGGAPARQLSKTHILPAALRAYYTRPYLTRHFLTQLYRTAHTVWYTCVWLATKRTYTKQVLNSADRCWVFHAAKRLVVWSHHKA